MRRCPGGKEQVLVDQHIGYSADPAPYDGNTDMQGQENHVRVAVEKRWNYHDVAVSHEGKRARDPPVESHLSSESALCRVLFEPGALFSVRDPRHELEPLPSFRVEDVERLEKVPKALTLPQGSHEKNLPQSRALVQAAALLCEPRKPDIAPDDERSSHGVSIPRQEVVTVKGALKYDGVAGTRDPRFIQSVVQDVEKDSYEFLRAEHILLHGNERLAHGIALEPEKDRDAESLLDRDGRVKMDFTENEHEVGLFCQPSRLQPGFRRPSENQGSGRKALPLVRRGEPYL